MLSSSEETRMSQGAGKASEDDRTNIDEIVSPSRPLSPTASLLHSHSPALTHSQVQIGLVWMTGSGLLRGAMFLKGFYQPCLAEALSRSSSMGISSLRRKGRLMPISVNGAVCSLSRIHSLDVCVCVCVYD